MGDDHEIQDSALPFPVKISKTIQIKRTRWKTDIHSEGRLLSSGCPANCINSTCSFVFARHTLNVPYDLQWTTKCSQIALSPDGGSALPPNPWFSGPTKVHNPNGISIGSAVLAQRTM